MGFPAFNTVLEVLYWYGEKLEGHFKGNPP
jgi:hypothetical protein